jgi:hypothetical protein
VSLTGLDCAHHHLADVQADADLQIDALSRAQFLGAALGAFWRAERAE